MSKFVCEPDPVIGSCVSCSAPFKPDRDARKRASRHCSDACWSQWDKRRDRNGGQRRVAKDAVWERITCASCGEQFDHLPSYKGRRPRCCSDRCREDRANELKRRAYGEAVSAGAHWSSLRQMKDFRCRVCGTVFKSAQTTATCCGPACVTIRKREARREQLAARALKPTLPCAHCGQRFLPARGGQKQKLAGYVQKCCSYECAKALRGPPKYESRAAANRAYLARRRAALAAARPIRFCKTCSSPLSGSRRSYCSDACLPKPRSTAKAEYDCRVCGAAFAYVKTGGMPKTTCSPTCAAEHKRESMRIGRAIRRAREKAARVEAVSPTRVFDRDGWRCQECKRPTPKKLRGTMAPNAPELDHIVPLAAGGEHSYRNCQCLCRACNGAKSDGPGGQMLLFG